MRYKIPETQFEIRFKWVIDEDGDHQLNYDTGYGLRYWGMVCPHRGDLQIVAEGRSFLCDSNNIADARREAENYCVNDAMHNFVSVIPA